MKIVHSPLHLRHDGGMELHRGELVPCFESPARADYIREALVEAGHTLVAPRAFGTDSLLGVHDADFVDFLRTAWTRWREEGRDGFMLPSGFLHRHARGSAP